MKLNSDVHQQFADYFPFVELRPYLYTLSKKLSEGHICINVNKMDVDGLKEMGYPSLIGKRELQKHPMISDGRKVSPLILSRDLLYLQRYYQYETIILERMKGLIEREPMQEEERTARLHQHTNLLNTLFSPTSGGGNLHGSGSTNWPLIAAVSAVLNNFMIITGGPGTGKTTTVSKILRILFSMDPRMKVALTAPTGKAAARMAESIRASAWKSDPFQQQYDSLEPSTIHRLLGTVRNSPHFSHNHENPLPYDVIIADEASMIDVALFAHLLDAVGPETRLILLGDKDQLASVEAGSLFGDLCQAQTQLNHFNPQRAQLINSFITDSSQQLGADAIEPQLSHPLTGHVTELRQSHRFSDHEGIGKFSKAIIQNKPDEIKNFFLNQDPQIQIDPSYSEKIFEEFALGFESFIKENDIFIALKKLNELRILCAVREGEYGLYAINKKVEKYLHYKKLIHLSGDWYTNRPIMVTANNPDLQLFNGDVGIIRPDEHGVLKAWFELDKGEIRSVLPGYISNAETVFAMTIHKSQGSEFDKVLVCLPGGEALPILTRELLYTAVTRARNKVIIQGSASSILQAAEARVQRASGITGRISEN